MIFKKAGMTAVEEKSAIIILGASGDLARRKLIPALSVLREQNLITPDSIIVGEGRSEFTDEEFRDRFSTCCEFREQLFYHQGIDGLRDYISSKGEFSKIIAFLSLPPASYASTIKRLYNEGFRDEVNIVIEKPFGRDYESAHELNESIHRFYSEKQIFRSDHYLAKEAVQNILIFRFANSIFEASWNSNYIESIQINAFESIGVEERGGYFDHAGSIRDMVQNHLLQMLCLTTMDPPVSLDPEDIKNQKINILKAIEIEEVSRGRYSGYLDEKDVAPDSDTETWAEMKLKINNHRWAGTPVYIRTGKALDRKGTEIGLRFKKRPHALYNPPEGTAPNEIIFKVQPSEGIVLQLTGKNPGMDLQLARTDMAFCYSNSFNEDIPEAYQKLLLDALRGDHTLFVSAEETELAWKKLNGITNRGELTPYEKGSVPESVFGDIWINFENYVDIC
ncbi:MAG: glucose-6-phosphate dehydrogenase [Spirochaetales bacterium]|uniref:Glucose-6-phosphate 1-dehydrogenase n=1 Tax=Candidatus Thalassospirochaeta sargassi TaxID=3119039 RepID=A0AAJ1MJG6_9SPIO|nr:glucose-6-phosphate dehydrogenase [Spirochaetales bacterium]